VEHERLRRTLRFRSSSEGRQPTTFSAPRLLCTMAQEDLLSAFAMHELRVYATPHIAILAGGTVAGVMGMSVTIMIDCPPAWSIIILFIFSRF
jgi:hypothetical protein